MNYIGTARHGKYQNGIAYTGTAGTSSALSTEAYKVYVIVTTDAWVTTDSTTATSSNGTYVPALTPLYFTVSPGQTVSAVQVAAGGTLNIAEAL